VSEPRQVVVVMLDTNPMVPWPARPDASRKIAHRPPKQLVLASPGVISATRGWRATCSYPLTTGHTVTNSPGAMTGRCDARERSAPAVLHASRLSQLITQAS